MEKRRLLPAGTSVHALLGSALVVGLASWIGCAADRTLAPDRTWEEVRYHWSEGQVDGSFGDLTIRSSGSMVWNLHGEGASTRGLLAGENLEMLARLIDALPPADYMTSAGDCGREVFVAVTGPEGQRLYVTGDCDANAPASLRTLIGKLDGWLADPSERGDPIAFRVLARGSSSRLSAEARRIAMNRDELLSLIDQVGGGIGVIPAVDFRRELVVGIFLGSRPTSGFEVNVSAAYRTEEQQIVLAETRTEPASGCQVAAVSTSPFVIVSVEAAGGEDVLSEIETIVRSCP